MEKDDDPNGIDEYEAQYFDNLEASRHKDMSNSHSGIRMAYTHPGNPAGPTITLRVKAGDEINLEVYAKYDDTETPQVVDGELAEALTNSVNDAVVGLEGGALSTAVGTNIAALIAAATPAEGKPKAYLQYVLFDESFTKVGDGYIPVDKGIDENGWKYLLRSDEVAFDGYLYAYVVNESNLDVFFDDFTVQVLGTRAIRKTDYYPFGAVAKQWNNPDQTQQEKYRHGYQGQFAEMDTTTGWNSFELRMYDPIIGRWLQVDPMRQYVSPYNGNGNNPISNIDPTGGYNPIHGSDGKFRGYDSEGVGGDRIVYDGAFRAGMDQQEILDNGGVFESNYIGEILFEASFPKPLDLNNSAELLLEGIVNWSIYINEKGRDPNGNPLVLGSMIAKDAVDNDPATVRAFKDAFGSLIGTNSNFRTILDPNGDIAVTMQIMDKNFKSNPNNNEVSHPEYDVEYNPYRILWKSWDGKSTLFYIHFRDHAAFHYYKNAIGL